VSRNALINQSAEDIDMDKLIDHSETMAPLVHPPSVPDSSLLTTACADQDQRYIVNSRLLIAVSHVIVNMFDGMGWNDESGCLFITKPLSTNALHCRYSSKKMQLFIIVIIVMLILLCSIGSTAAAASSTGSPSIYALNTNGFVHPMKIDATNRAISYRNPNVVVITETKTNSLGSSKMSYNDYQFFEERGTPVTNHHLYKWGNILGIKKGITVSQCVLVNHPALIGRLVTVDIMILTDAGHRFIHCIIAVYAPWDVDDTIETAAFWTEASKLCAGTPNSWTLLSDLNAMVTQAEQKSGSTDAHIHFNNFL
jgi:hypothetical protein